MRYPNLGRKNKAISDTSQKGKNCTVINDLSPVENYLADTKNYERRSEDSESWLIDLLKKIKVKAIEQGDQEGAKVVWCLETIHEIQKNYIAAFFEMKEGRFYDGWRLLESVSLDTLFLQRHYSPAQDDQYKISFIEKHVEQFQALYPYRLFLSPGVLQLEKICTICGQQVSLRNFCGHRKGEIYNGEMCVHKITKEKILEVSLVTNPIQKYSVVFLKDPDTGEEVDQYDYSIIKYVITALKHPFDGWDIQKTKIRHPHALFSHLTKYDDCPCGSNKPYGKCCLKNREGVLRPHMNILFHVPPNWDTPQIVYPSYNKKA
jgi:hypothetical protein